MDTSKLNDDQKRKVAIAFLVQTPEECPEALKKYVDKLREQEITMKGIMHAASQAKEALKELSRQAQAISGGIAAITDMAAVEVPADKINEWSSRFNLDDAMQDAIDNDLRSDDGNIDMAGQTAKNLPPIQTPKR